MAGETAAEATGRRLASADGLELAIPECVKGIGAVVSEVSSPNLIAGVRVEPYAIHADDRGYFLEVLRLGRGLAAEFPAETTQISAALNYLGTVKAFHYHLHQTDCWVPMKGMLQVALVDLRLGSPTFGQRTPCTWGCCAPGRC
jgi:dTDP-4-dehydrorhamnose 3,5-epimerase